MPTIKGDKSKKAHSKNVSEMMDAYAKTGKIGTARPRNKRHAIQIANAAAYTSAKAPKKKNTRANNLKLKGTAMERFAISRGAKPKRKKGKK